MSAPFRTVELSDPRHEHGGVRHATVASAALGGRVDCTLWAPPSGDPLPLVILLHGAFGSHWAWTHLAGAHHIASGLIERGETRPFALAMPSDGLVGLGTGYLDRPGHTSSAWLLDEVPALAELALPNVDANAPVALAGLSMGGFGALRLGAANPSRVVAAAGLSSITHVDQLATFGASIDGTGVRPGQESVIDAVRRSPGPLPRLSIDCGSDDVLIEPNRRLHAELDADGVAHEWRERDGGHSWAYWERGLPDMLRFVVAGFG